MSPVSSTASCPKLMEYGPCGGVQADHSCEVDDRPCPFVDEPVAVFRDGGHRPRPISPQIVGSFIVDHRPSGDAGLDRAILSRFADRDVTVLLGDHLDDPPGVDRVEVVRDAKRSGVGVIATVTGRGRHEHERVALWRAFLDAGADAILCVTGDHPAARFGANSTAPFDTEGTKIAAEVRRDDTAASAVIAVAESPDAPPGAGRHRRLKNKQSAGADLAILNHCGSAADILAFVATCRSNGVDVFFGVPVPVVTDATSLSALTQFPGIRLPPQLIQAGFENPDQGIRFAADMSAELLASPDIDHVNLSGIATGDGPLRRAEIMCEVIDCVRRR